MTKNERELVTEVINSFQWHQAMKHGKSMARLREAVANLEAITTSVSHTVPVEPRPH